MCRLTFSELGLQDSVLGGRIRVDIPSQQLEYRKRLALGSGAHVGLTARCDYAGLLMGRASQLNPSFGIQYELGGGAAIWAGNVFDLRQKLRVSRSLGFEVSLETKVLVFLQRKLHKSEAQNGLKATFNHQLAADYVSHRYVGAHNCPCLRRSTLSMTSRTLCHLAMVPFTCTLRRSM